MSSLNQNPINHASLEAIKRRIDLYRSGRILLPHLAQDLHGIIFGISNWPEGLRAKYMSLWEAIEEINALALDQGFYSPLPHHEEFLKKTLQDLQTLVDQNLSE